MFGELSEKNVRFDEGGHTAALQAAILNGEIDKHQPEGFGISMSRTEASADIIYVQPNADGKTASAKCPQCQKKFGVLQRHVGRHVRCPNCSVRFSVAVDPGPAEEELPPRVTPMYVWALIIIGSIAFGYTVGRWHARLEVKQDLETVVEQPVLEKIFEQ